MNNLAWIEYVGYIASVLIVISMFMKDMVKLRFTNLAGAILFSVYGFIIKSYPVAIVNLIVSFADMYYLFRMYDSNETE